MRVSEALDSALEMLARIEEGSVDNADWREIRELLESRDELVADAERLESL